MFIALSQASQVSFLATTCFLRFC